MLLIFIIFFILLFPHATNAVCPVCALAVGAGVGLSRWLGIDDTITGLWVGGLIVSLIGWTINWLNGKNLKFLGRQPLIVILYYVITIWPLYQLGVMGHLFNKIWGIDKLLAGIIIGSLVFIAGVIAYEYLKKRNSGRAYFPFQKVAMPVGALIIASLIFYLMLR